MVLALCSSFGDYVNGQTITVHESDVKEITFYLNDSMLDLNQHVNVEYEDKLIESIQLYRNFDTIRNTLRDPKDFYTASLSISLP